MHIFICSLYESSVLKITHTLLETRIDNLAFYKWIKQKIKYCQPDHFVKADNKREVC